MTPEGKEKFIEWGRKVAVEMAGGTNLVVELESHIKLGSCTVVTKVMITIPYEFVILVKFNDCVAIHQKTDMNGEYKFASLPEKKPSTFLFRVFVHKHHGRPIIHHKDIGHLSCDSH